MSRSIGAARSTRAGKRREARIGSHAGTARGNGRGSRSWTVVGSDRPSPGGTEARSIDAASRGHRWLCAGRANAALEAVAEGEQLEVEALLEPAPQAAGHEEGEDDRGDAEADEVPGAAVGEPVLDGEEGDGADQRALEGAEAADEDHEDHVGGPLDAEDRLRLDEEGVGADEPPRGAAAERGEDEEEELAGVDADAERRGGVLVVADRLERGAGGRAQDEEHEAEQEDDEGEGEPGG